MTLHKLTRTHALDQWWQFRNYHQLGIMHHMSEEEDHDLTLRGEILVQTARKMRKAIKDYGWLGREPRITWSDSADHADPLGPNRIVTCKTTFPAHTWYSSSCMNGMLPVAIDYEASQSVNETYMNGMLPVAIDHEASQSVSETYMTCKCSVCWYRAGRLGTGGPANSAGWREVGEANGWLQPIPRDELQEFEEGGPTFQFTEDEDDEPLRQDPLTQLPECPRCHEPVHGTDYATYTNQRTQERWHLGCAINERTDT